MALKALMISKIGTAIALEKLTAYRAATRDDVPQSAEAMTPAWLTAVLCRDVPGAAVTDVELTGGSDGTTSRRALRVTYNGAGEAAGLPTRIFAKTTPFFRSRLQQASIAKPQCEVGFYNEIRPELDMEATAALHAAYDARTGRTVMLFEDIAATRNVRFLNIFDEVTRDMAEDMVRLMASYHGPMWRDPRLSSGRYPWLRSVLTFQHRLNSELPFEACNYTGMGRASASLSETLMRQKEAVWQAHMRSLEICCDPTTPQTLIHWDVHIGNWYLTPERRMGLTDWNMNSGNWATDYAYAIATALTTEDRRAWERDLLRLYLEELGRWGVPDVPAFDDAWRAYRQQMFHGFMYWTFTLGIGALQPRMQLPPIALRNIERTGQALVDLESLQAVDG